MASTSSTPSTPVASGSTSTAPAPLDRSTITLSVVDPEVRPQAGPLPRKRGEIGYVEGQEEERGEEAQSTVHTLPERHPADRDAPPPISDNEPIAPSTQTPSEAHSDTPDTSSAHTAGKRSIISRLKPRKLPHIFGISFATLFFVFFQLAFLGGTAAAWAISVKRFSHPAGNTNGDPDTTSPGSANIFIHVVFAIATVGQLLLLERRVYRLRAERYGYLHPGEMLPRHRRSSSSSSFGFAPWNRPPLPTYAATLAASGYGTGDVEDHIIAAPPPPAYGNTRGSTLILAGFLRESLRAQRPASQRSQSSIPADRPLSYVSRDEGWEEICDAERARTLEQTLATLEEGRPRPPPAAVVRD